MPIRSFFKPEVGFFFLFWLLIMVLFRTQAFNDPGAFWHIRVGEYIFENGFPKTDPFTWSYHHQPWIPQQWLAECIIAKLHGIGEFDTLLFTMATLVGLFATWMTNRFVASGLHWMLAVVLVGIGISIAGFHFYIRPHLVTILLMGVVMALLIDTERKGVRWNLWFAMIPLCLIWTNLHGGVLGGIVTMGIAVFGWTILYLLKRPSPVTMMSRNLGLTVVLMLCTAMIFINPFGLELQRTWWKIVGSSELSKYINEHRPLDLTTTNGLAVLGFGLFYLILLAGTYPNRLRLSWLIPIIWFLLSLTSIRHGSLFAITALVAITDLFPYTMWYRLLKKYGDTLIRDPQPMPSGTRRFVVPGLFIVLCLVLQSEGVRAPLVGRGWASFDAKGIPVQLIQPLREYQQNVPKGYPIFNDANLGGFLLYFAPKLKIYMDDRCELYGDEGIRNYIELMSHPERIQELMIEMHFNRLLVSPNTPMDDYLKAHPESFHELSRVPAGVLYERLAK